MRASSTAALVGGALLVALLSLFAPCPVRAAGFATVLNPVGIYGSVANAQQCLNITWTVAYQVLNGPDLPNCLRFAFHDAGTYSINTQQGGADGSIMYEMSDTASTFLTNCYNNILQIQAGVRNWPGGGCNVTAADAIQIAGAVGVAKSQGPACPMIMGRPDATAADPVRALPDPCDNAGALISRFTLAGFKDPVKSLVVLSGAHNIGRVQNQTRGAPGPGQCSRGPGPMTADPNTFDGHYYTEIVQNTGRRGWFNSDRTLANPNSPDTRALMVAYSNNHSAFLADWCAHYQEASLLGVNTDANGFTGTFWPVAVIPRPNPPNGGGGNNGGNPRPPRPNPNNGGGGGGGGGPNNGGGPNGGGGGGGGGPNGGGGGPNGGGGGGGGRGRMLLM